MSVVSVPIAMSKIKSATTRSPIAIFRLTLEQQKASKSKNGLDAIFAATVLTQQRILADDLLLVGVFDNTMSVAAVRRKLRNAINL